MWHRLLLFIVAVVAVVYPIAPTSAADTTVSWTSAGHAGQVPSNRGGARMSRVGGTLVLFGGFDECFSPGSPNCENNFATGTFHFDLASQRWSQSAAAVEPSVRAFFSQDAYPANESVIAYGGVKYNAFFTEFLVRGDLWEYFPRRQEWRQRTPVNQGPGHRLGSGLQIDGHRMYVFGGLGQDFVGHNDVWMYDLQTNRWTQLIPDGAAGSPPARYIAQFELSAGESDRSNRILLFGGNDSRYVGSGIQWDDTWSYDIAANRWTQIPTPMPGRIHGAGAVYKDHFVVALGDINDDASECQTTGPSTGQKPTEEVWALGLKPSAGGWARVAIGASPPPLKRVAFARVDDKLYVWGGFNFLCPVQQTAGQVVWNRDMWILPLRDI